MEIDKTNSSNKEFRPRIKSIVNYSVPNSYIKELEKFYKKLILQHRDNLLLFFVSGSFAREDIIRRWSDIDVIIVFRECNSDIRTSIELIRRESSIKIGYTTYSKWEFENSYIDSKTKLALTKIINNEIYVNFISNEVRLPKINEQDLIESNKNLFFEYYHELKRLSCYELSNAEYQKQIKVLYLIMKCLLSFKRNTFIDGYNNVFNQFAIEFKKKKLCMEEIVSGSITKVEVRDYVNEIIDCIAEQQIFVSQ